MTTGPLLDCRERARRLAGLRPAEARRACGIRQATIAEALGVDKSTVGCWERGRHGPSGTAGDAYCRVIAGLMRHLEVPEERPPGPGEAP